MSRFIVSGIAFLLLLSSGSPSFAGETLRDTLRTAKVPMERFPESDLAAAITSFAVANGNPFLLAYYVEDEPGSLKPPLRVIRYDRKTGELRRAAMLDIHALFQGDVPQDCLGSVLQIREHRGLIYIDTHSTPSAGCVVVLSSALARRAALSGRLLGWIGANYAIVLGSEIHFMSVHPMHIVIFDIKTNRSTQAYPFQADPLRRQFSRLIERRISRRWCIEFAAQCDPENFNVQGKVILNDVGRAFGFLARFNADGFGDAASTQIAPRMVAYIFRERGGRWEHREFDARQLQRLLKGANFDELISTRPDFFFQWRWPGADCDDLIHTEQSSVK